MTTMKKLLVLLAFASIFNIALADDKKP